MSISKNNLIEEAKIFKALGHPTRLLLVYALKEKELCVQELRNLAGDDISTISRHLTQLKEAGILATRRQGTSIYYKIGSPQIISTITSLEAFIKRKNHEEALSLERKEKS